MIGIDTNVLVRVLVEDDPDQVRRVRTLLDGAAERSEVTFISDIVLCELEWVLEAAYDVPRERILQTLQTLVASEHFGFEDRARFVEALDLYHRGMGDLSDYLIGLSGRERGVATTYTFDRALRDDEHFTLP